MKINLFLLFFLSVAKSEIHYSAKFELRTDPRAMNVTATVASDHLLRGQQSKEKPFYSYGRLGLVAGGSPTLGAFIDYAPIAPLIFSVQKSFTHRFQDSSRFDCENYQCKKNVDRTDYSVRGIVAYGKFFFTQNYIWREMKTDADMRPVYLEQEHAVVTSGFHRFTEATSILGFEISKEQIIGVLYTADWLSEGRFRSHTASVFFRQKWGDFSLTFGLNEYKYEQFDIQGPAGFLTVNFNQGQKLSLF